MKSCRFPQFFTLALLAFVTFGFVAVSHIQAEEMAFGVPTPDELAGGKWLQAYSQGRKTYPIRLSYSSIAPLSGELFLTTLFASDNGYAGNMFDLQVNELLTITRFQINVSNPGSTNTIEIYYRMGTCVGHEDSSDGWILLGTDNNVVSNGTDIPTPVNIGGLILEPGQVYGFYVNVASYPSSGMNYTNGGPTIFSNAQMSLTTNCGKGEPAFTGSTFYPRQWNGTIYYTVGPPDDLRVAPPEGFSSSGCEGGPFTPSSKDYTLSNTGAAAIDWTAEVNVPWLDVALNAGTLLPDQNTVVSVSINANANGLAVGSYSGEVVFTNLASGFEQVRVVSLTVNEIPPPPPPPHDPDPADRAVLVDVNTLLQWNGGGGGSPELQNGGFETGDFTGWTTVTGPGEEFQPWTLATAGSGVWFGNGIPFEGTYFAQNGFDGEAGLFYDIYQEVAIPAGALSAQLEWSERLQWDTTYGAIIARPYEVTLQPAGGGPPIAVLFSTTLPPGTTGDTGYVTHSVDLLAAAPGIAGQTVRINFHQYIPESHTGPAQFDLDGASLAVIDGASLKQVELGRSSYNKASPIAGMYPSRSPLKDRSAYLKMKEKALASKIRDNRYGSKILSRGTAADPAVAVTRSVGNLAHSIVTDNNEIVIDASDRGWWRSNGYHDASNKNTYTGATSGYDLHSFFVFDLRSVSADSFVNAKLRLEIESYYGPDPSESLTISDVTTPISILTSSGTNVAVYNDLGSGNSYGTFTVLSTDVGRVLEITLSSQALTDLGAAAGGFFAVGLKVDNIGLPSGTEGVRFSSGSETRVHQLVLTPGIPATYDVYFDTVNPPVTLIHSGLTAPHCEPVPHPLACETTYYWQVVASNPRGQTAGPVWSFTTIGPPGEIEVTDSIPPPDDLNMPFGEVIVGLSRTEHITITNTDPTYGLAVTDINLSGGGAGGVIEDFEDGDMKEYVILGGTHIVTAAAAHDGSFGLQSDGADWAYRNDADVTVTQGNIISYWLYLRSTDGRAYCGFGASNNGTYSFVAAPNTGELILQRNQNFDFLNIGAVPNTWTYNKWYRMEVKWDVGGGMTGRLYDSDGTTLLKTVTANDTTYVSGGIAFRSFGNYSNYFDTVERTTNPANSILSVSSNSEDSADNNRITTKSESREVVGWDKENYAPIYKNQEVAESLSSSDESPAALNIQSTPAVFRLENIPALPVVIPPGCNITFDVNFGPTELKEYNSSVTIKSNDTNEPEVEVLLNGTGILDYMKVTPDANFTFSGHPGGPFLPSNTYYYLTNNGMVNISWTVTGPDWLNIGPPGGIIKPGETTKVKVAPNALARSKGEGVYVGQLLFTDVTTTVQQTRNVILNISTEPKIWITPYFFDVNVYQGSGESENLAIGNGGDGLLNFTLIGRQTGFTPASKPAAAVYDLMVETKKDVAAMAPAKHSFTAMTENAAFAEGRMLVRFAPEADRKYPGLTAKNSILAKAGNGKLAAASVVKEYKIVRGLSLIKLPDNVAVKDALVTLNNTPGILYAEPDYQVKALSTGQIIPNDPLFSELWGLNNTGQGGGTPDADIDAPEAWDVTTDGSNIIVAVIDTGVDYTHPDLAANMWVNAAEANGIPGFDDDGNGYIDDIYGYDFVNNDGDPMDDHYHGTHVSGTIGAVGNNGIGVAGVCWNVKIMALKFLDSGGGGYTDDAIECIQYAILMGANLSSNSWGGGGYSQALKDAIDAAGNANQLFVAAAGNSSSNNDITPAYPASYTSQNIIAVLATDRYDNMSSFSNYGPTSVDIGAPGSNILSCQPGSNYQYLNGTSMATPHVSGAAALIWSFYPSMPYQEVKDLLIQTADKIPALAGRCVSEGRLNLYNAVKEVGVSWLEFVPQSGSALPGEVNNVSVLFHGDVPVGTYQGQITVSTNDPYTPETNIPVTMTVKPLDYFTEMFDAGDNDMANRTLTFVPNGSPLYYSLCTVPASEFPVNPAGGTIITLHDDDYYEVLLQGHTINFYGTSYDTFYIGSNGYITFVSGDTHYFEQFTEHFALPRISALFDDLNPSAGGTISYKELPNRVVVTFQNVPEFSQTTTNSFQVEMFFCGRIRITFLNIAAVDGLTGLSQGSGVPVYFSESNLSEYGPCDTSVKVDFDMDCDVDFVDYAVFANQWTDQDCAEPNWCSGADLNENGSVDLYDLAEFAKYWLEGL